MAWWRERGVRRSVCHDSWSTSGLHIHTWRILWPLGQTVCSNSSMLLPTLLCITYGTESTCLIEHLSEYSPCDAIYSYMCLCHCPSIHLFSPFFPSTLLLPLLKWQEINMDKISLPHQSIYWDLSQIPLSLIANTVTIPQSSNFVYSEIFLNHCCQTKINLFCILIKQLLHHGKKVCRILYIWATDDWHKIWSCNDIE